MWLADVSNKLEALEAKISIALTRAEYSVLRSSANVISSITAFSCSTVVIVCSHLTNSEFFIAHIQLSCAVHDTVLDGLAYGCGPFEIGWPFIRRYRIQSIVSEWVAKIVIVWITSRIYLTMKAIKYLESCQSVVLDSLLFAPSYRCGKLWDLPSVKIALQYGRVLKTNGLERR